MALAPLASTTDLLDRGDIPAGNSAVALAVASALIRDAAGCSISSVTSTVNVTGTAANLLPLPGPVSAVASVTLDDGTVVTDYQILPGGLWRHCGWAVQGCITTATVVYTHGLAVVPVDIVDLTCNLALAWLSHAVEGGGSTAGVAAWGIDDAHETLTAEASGQISPAYIPDATRQWLARRFGTGVAVVESL